MKWAADNPELFAMMERTYMYIFRYYFHRRFVCALLFYTFKVKVSCTTYIKLLLFTHSLLTCQ